MSLHHYLGPKPLQLLYFGVLLPLLAFSQMPKDTVAAHALKVQADSLFKSRQYDKAIRAYGKAKKAYIDSEYWVKVVLCTNLEARSYFGLRRYEKAHDKIQQSFALISEKITDTVFEQGQAYDLLSYYYEVQKSDFEKAIAYLKKADHIFRTLPNSDGWLAKSYNNSGAVYMQMGDYKNGIEYIKKSLQQSIKAYGQKHSAVSAAYTNLGLTYNRLGDYETAAENYKNAVDIDIELFGETHPYVINTYLNLGALYQNIGQYSKALHYTEKALALIDKKQAVNDPLAAKLYTTIAIIHQRRKQPEKSIQYSKEALRIWDEIYNGPHLEFEDALKAMASGYYGIGEYDTAIATMLKVLDINLGAVGENHFKVAGTYGELGDYHRAKGDYNLALESHLKSLEIYENIYGTYHATIAEAYHELAVDYAMLHNDSLRIDYLEKAKSIREKIFASDSDRKVNGFIDLGNAYLKVGKMTKARKILDSINTWLRHKRHQTIGTTKQDLDYNSLMIFMRSYRANAQWHKVQATKKNTKEELEKALNYFYQMDSIIEIITVRHDFHDDKLRFRSSVQSAYQEAVETSVRYLEYDESALEQTYFFMEKARATTLRQLLNEKYIKTFSGLPDTLVEVMNDLKIKRAYYHSQIAQVDLKSSLDSIQLKKYEKNLFMVNRRYDSIIAMMGKQYPDYFKLRYKTEIVPLKEVIASLPEDTAMLSYLYNEDFLYVFIISREGAQVLSLKVDDLNEELLTLTDALTTQNLPLYKKKAQILYETLLAPIKSIQEKKELIIAPYSELWQLNFDLLLTDEVTTNNPKKLPYVLKKHAISYVNSASVRFSRPAARKDVLEECLAFSFTGDETAIPEKQEVRLERLRDGITDLPGTRKEISEIASVFDGVYYYGDEAKEANFKKYASQYAILHLALHGEVNDKNPNNSRLFFTQTNDSLEDDHLFAHELYAMKLNAELAVLSACSTGDGKVSTGEGLMSLGNAFQYAGTKSLLLSQWEVADNSAPNLMGQFYTNLKNGMSKSKALQQAKLSYLESADLNRVHPLYWGSFYLLGNNKPIEFSNMNYSYWVFLAFLILLAGFFVWNRRNTK